MLHIPLNDISELRELSLDDAPALFAMVDANRQRLREWLPWLDFNTEVKHSREFIETCIKNAAATGCPTFGIRFHGTLVGVAGFQSPEKMNRKVNIGYWIAESAEGKGLVAASVKALVHFGFTTGPFNRIELRCATENLKSQRVAEKAGFIYEGILREAEYLYGRFVDHKVYSRLKREY